MFYKISKIIFVLFLFYIVWFQQVFFQINNAPLILGVGMLFFLFLHALTEKNGSSFLITKPLLIWIIFSIYVLFTGYLVAFNKQLLISSVMTYVQTLAMMVFIVDVSRREKSNDFFIKTFALLALLYSINLLFFGYEYYPGRIIISEDANPNQDGLTLLYGVFCIMILLNTKKTFSILLSYTSILMIIYSIILTGSRKAFYAVILLFIFGTLISVKDVFKLGSIKQKFMISFLIIFTFLLTLRFSSQFFESSLYSRLTEGITSSDYTRLEMYDVALHFFYSNPLFGIGFNQFREFYGTYSHSTYAEILSTTGIFGTILYFIPYIIIIFNLIHIHLKEREAQIPSQALTYILLMIVMLALGTGVIHFYGITNSLALALMISFYYTYSLSNTDFSSNDRK